MHVPFRHNTAAHNGWTVGFTGMHFGFPFTTTHFVPTLHNVAIQGLTRTKDEPEL
jgi:hypothetical protein